MTVRTTRSILVVVGILIVASVVVFAFVPSRTEKKSALVPVDSSSASTSTDEVAPLPTETQNTSTSTGVRVASSTEKHVEEVSPAPAKDDPLLNTPPPRLDSVTPARATIGTPLTLRGVHLAGFEGSLDAWIEFEDGRVGFLPAYGATSYPRTDTITVRLSEYVCAVDTSYSGLRCPTEYRLEPGTYSIYTKPWGTKSNALSLEIEGAACAGLSESACYQTPECRAVFGPSSCSGDTCTADIGYRGCESMIPYSLDYAARPLSHVPWPTTTYIDGEDSYWPPYFLIEAQGSFVCSPDEPLFVDGLPAETVKRRIGNRTYCITTMQEGAAGSNYITYTYTTQSDKGLAKLWFTLRYRTCGAYDGEEAKRCTEEREAFDVDALVSDILENAKKYDEPLL